MFIPLLLSVFTLCCASQKSFEVKNSEFQHLVVSQSNGEVFIGAVNKIYHLSEDLVVKKWVSTGPISSSDSKLTDNRNTVLILDDYDRLVTCGSALGICSTRNVDDINIGCDVPINVVPHEDVPIVAFLSPIGSTNYFSRRKLYLGTGVGNNEDIPTISKRLLDQNNDFLIENSDPYRYSQNQGLQLQLNSLYIKDVDVRYVYGFNVGRFIYFVKTQKNKDGDYHSVIARICQDDGNYYNSYTEIPIVCQNKDNVTYNIVQTAFVAYPGELLAESLNIATNDDVLFAFFTLASENSSIPEKTAMCVFTLNNICKKFGENIQKCYNGEASTSLGLTEPRRCVVTKTEVNYLDFCSLAANAPLDGEIPVKGIIVMYLTEKITAMVATRVRVHTIVIVGTSSGHLKTIIVDNTTKAVEYEDLVVQEGISINKDLVFSPQKDHIFAMTKNKVTKIPILQCSIYMSYAECVEDLYCGWCSVNRKCTSEMDCEFEDPLLRVSTDSESQTVITEVTPDTVFITKEKLLTIKIENVDLKDQLFCNFILFGVSFVTNATKVGNDVQCIPVFNSAIYYDQGPNPIPVKLFLQNSLTEPPFAATVVNFQDCNCYNSCTECIADVDCNWCLYGGRCIRDGSQACLNDSIISHQNKTQLICPSIVSTDVRKYIPSGEKVKIHVKVQLVGFFIVQSRFLCRFNIEEGKVLTVNAQLLGDSIYCDEVKFEYTSSAIEQTVPFDIIWGGSKKLDNSGKTHIVLYKCDKMANNLDNCEKLPKLYSCKWCEKANSCLFQDFC